MTDRILRFPEVQQIAGFNRDTIRRMGKEGRFPAAVKIGVRQIGWRESEVRAWLESRKPKGAA